MDFWEEGEEREIWMMMEGIESFYDIWNNGAKFLLLILFYLSWLHSSYAAK